jgi:purine nucleosidase
VLPCFDRLPRNLTSCLNRKDMHLNPHGTNHDDTIPRLDWPQGPIDLVLDTDTFNEIDDQFALVYTMLSAPRINLRAVHAAPFHNGRSSGPGDGMEKSYEEILRIFDIMGADPRNVVFRGSKSWLPGRSIPVDSAARDDLIERARARTDTPLYVAAIGAITNVASALLAAPDIRERIVVLWLAGHPLHWPDTSEFNMRGDPIASRVVLDCGVPLILFPCRLVAELITTTQAELAEHLAGKTAIGDYLYRIFCDYETRPPLTQPGRSKVIWDLAPIAWLIDQGWFTTRIQPSPILNPDLTWDRDPQRHPIRVAEHLHRDGIFADLFAKACTACTPVMKETFSPTRNLP